MVTKTCHYGHYKVTIKKDSNGLSPLFYLAPQPGLEPGTHGLTVHCSTN